MINQFNLLALLVQKYLTQKALVGRECRWQVSMWEGGEGAFMPFLLESSVCPASNTEIAAFPDYS